MAQLITIKGTPVTAANEVLVADSNSKIPAVDGSLVTTMAGGGHPQIDNIQKVSFSTDGNATDVGNLINAKAYCMGYHD